MAQLKATITITLAGNGLAYAIAGDGLAITPKKHRVQKNTFVEWICPDGDIAVLFATTPFTTNQTVLSAVQNVSTGFLKTKNRKKAYKYSVVVASPGLTIEDPILDVSDDAGGGGAKAKKKAAKKSAPKKKK